MPGWYTVVFTAQVGGRALNTFFGDRNKSFRVHALYHVITYR
jgi:hypothetical protein